MSDHIPIPVPPAPLPPPPLPPNDPGGPPIQEPPEPIPVPPAPEPPPVQVVTIE